MRVMAVFNLLQQASHANLEKFIEVAGGNGQKFHPLQKRIAGVFRFFQYAPIEFQPRFFAI